MPGHVMPKVCAVVSPESQYLTSLSAFQVTGPAGDDCSRACSAASIRNFYWILMACCEGSADNEVLCTSHIQQ